MSSDRDDPSAALVELPRSALPMLSADYSHVANFTGYMRLVSDITREGPARQRILDIRVINPINRRHRDAYQAIS